jgi:hypothetical protein
VARVRQLTAGGADPAARTGDLLVALADVARAWQAHVADAESPAGLLAQIETDAPRCAPRVARLRREHAEIADQLGGAVLALRQAGVSAEASHRLPAAIETLVGAVDRHRAEGGDLIHEAYRVDIGGE